MLLTCSQAKVHAAHALAVALQQWRSAQFQSRESSCRIPECAAPNVLQETEAPISQEIVEAIKQDDGVALGGQALFIPLLQRCGTEASVQVEMTLVLAPLHAAIFKAVRAVHILLQACSCLLLHATLHLLADESGD